MKPFRTLTLIALVGAFLACGGGSDPATPVTPGPAPSTLVASFVTADPNPGANSTSMTQGGVSGDVVSVQVRVTNVNGLYGAAFELGYDPARTQFVGHSPGTVLEQGGNSPTYNVSAATAGSLVIGLSRTGQVPGVDVSGTQTLVNLSFRVLAAGSWPVTEVNASLIDEQIQAIPGVTWSTGSLQGI